MPLQASINLIANSIQCAAGSAIEFSFDVENTSDRTLLVGLEPLGESKGWVTFVRDQAEIELPARGLQRVALKVAVPSGTPAKRYTFRLRAYSPRTPTDVIESGAVSLDVASSAPAAAGASPPKVGTNRLPLIIAASAGGVVLIGAVVGLVIWLTGGGAPVPDLIGKTADEAAALLDEAGYVAPRVNEEVTDELAPGLVVRQRPGPGEDKPADGVVSIFMATAPPPPELTARDAERLATRWVAAVNAREIDTLVDMAEPPFFLDNEILVSKNDVRQRYVDMLRQVPEKVTPTRFDARTVGDFRAARLIDDQDRVTSKLNIESDDFAVAIYFGGEAVLVYFRRAGNRLEMAGFWD